MINLERRFYTGQLTIEKRANGDSNNPVITGYAARFNTLSQNLGGFLEMLVPNAFQETINNGDDVRALFNHDPSLILGRSTSGTLELEEDENGLIYRIIPPDTQAARDLMVSMERGDVNQSSFGFEVVEESWQHPTDDQPLPVRILRRVKLWDVSPVTFPAYTDTSVAVRAINQAKKLSVPQTDFTMRYKKLDLLDVL